MTLFKPYQIECSCGNLVDINIYNSVNVTVDPSLLTKVTKRKINNFKCLICGAESELAYHFLFVDMKNKQWIWCYPVADKEDRVEIEKEVIHSNGSMADIIGVTPILVFGYQELLEKILSNK